MTIYKPEVARIAGVRELTRAEKLFEIDMGRKFKHDPGQFVEVSVLGVGEAPISICSPPREDSRFELCVRSVGNVTGALHLKRPGETVGIRGPFGRGFDLRAFEGKDVVFIAGGLGLAPLRSLILAVLSNRNRFGRISILYGAKRPSDILFWDELQKWERRDDIGCMVTVDVAENGWRGNVGVVTTLIPQAEFDPENTVAAVVGPPVMYRFVIGALKDRGLTDDNIWVSLERKMKCGVGKCGHCQINRVYVCQDGPVFRYDEIKELPEAI